MRSTNGVLVRNACCPKAKQTTALCAIVVAAIIRSCWACVEPAEPSVPRPSSEGRTWAQVATGVANKTKLNNRYARTIANSLLR
jgi:hypothetical protein